MVEVAHIRAGSFTYIPRTDGLSMSFENLLRRAGTLTIIRTAADNLAVLSTEGCDNEMICCTAWHG